MKPVSEWDLNYILQLPAGEFDWLEFKGRKGLDWSLNGGDENKVLDDLSKQLSAFANSDGGVLAYGILNPMDHKQRSVDDGGILIALKKPNIREWLEDVIPNLVEFPLKKFNVYALTNTNGASDLADDRCIVLVHIPVSDDAPHQSRDQKYYARVGGKSKPIGHRLVTDIFHRGQHALFDISFSIKSQPFDFPCKEAQEEMSQMRNVQLVVKATNRGKIYAKHVHFTLQVPEEILPDLGNNDLIGINGVQNCILHYDNRRFVGAARNGNSWLDPILPSESRIWIFQCGLQLRPETINADWKLFWKLNCDNAPSMSGECLLKDINFIVQDKHAADELGPSYR